MPRILPKLLSHLRPAILCVLSLLATASLAQTTINVGPGQTYTTIQSGIDAANNGDTVLVAPGTYYENIDFKGKAITVTSSGSAANTIIDGGGIDGVAVVTFHSKETRTSVLSGFTIQHGGNKNGPSGIIVGPAAPTIRNNVILNNKCNNVEIGGATLFQGNTVGATDNSTYSLYCSFGGTGLLVYGSGSTDPNVQLDIIGNVIENSGGIVNFGGNGEVFIGNIIRNNTGFEGAIWIVNTNNFIFINNLVYGNQATGVSQYPSGAGGLTIEVPSGEPLSWYYGVIANNTFVNNKASSAEYAATQFFIEGDISAFNVSNNIFYGSGNLPAIACDGIYSYLSGPATFSHNDAFNPSGPAYDTSCKTATTNGNISRDPLFSNASGNDFQLTAASPLIDTGDDSVIAGLSLYAVSLTTDFAGTPRLQDATGTPCAIIDIGAYEYPGVINNCFVTETLQSSLNPSLVGQSVTFTAQLTSANGLPTGDIQFMDGNTVLSTQMVSGTGSSALNASSLAIGSHTITAAYQPTGNFGASTASLTQVVNGYPTNTTLTCSPNPITVFNTTLLTATLTSANGIPTGSIAFTDNGAPLATQALLSGTTSLTYTGSVAGTHTLTATYTPTGSFAASSASCSEVVTALPTTSTLTVNPVTSTYGSPVTLTATVSPATLPGPSTPTGTVTFSNGATAVGTGTLVNGVATSSLSTLPGGSYNLTCAYGGSSLYATSRCNSVPVTVNAAASTLTLSSSGSPTPALSPVTFTAHLTVNGQSAGAGNTIALSVNGQTVSLTTDATGSAAYTVNTLTPGTYPVVAGFATTSSLLASSASLTQVVTAIPTTTILVPTPNPAYLGQLVTMVAVVASPIPSTPVTSGTVTFFDGSTSLGTQPVTASGNSTFTTSVLAVGTHPITATFAPANTVFLASTSPIGNEVILPSGFTIALSPSTITLPPGAPGTVAIHLATVGDFSGPLALTYGALPASATASIQPATVTLATGGTGSSSLTLNTLLKASNSTPAMPGSRTLPVVLAALALWLIPSSRSRRTKLNRLRSLVVLVITLQTITGCTNTWYTAKYVSPGTYQLAVTATDSSHVSQTATLTIIVTP